MEIQKIGSVMKIGEDGGLVNETSTKYITGKWKGVADEVIEIYKHHLGEKLHSLYIRGSVARGKAIDGISDIDSIAVLNISQNELETIDLGWTKDEQDTLRERYPFQTRVEFYFISKENISFTDQFIIQSQSVCIYGDDLSHGFERIEFSKPTILKLIEENKIDHRIETAQLTIEKEDDPKKIAKVNSWIAKRFLRTGVLLAALKEPGYARDLYPSYELFVKQYPEKAGAMRKALEYAMNPTDNKLEVINFIDDLGSWLISKKVAITEHFITPPL